VSIDRPDAPAQLTALTDAAAALARGSDLDATLDGILRSTADAVGAGVAVLFLRDPDRPDLHLTSVAGMGADELAWLSDAVADPDHPIAIAARDVTAVFGREGIRPDGTPFVGADIPLAVARDGLDLPLGVVSFGWPAPRPLDANDERLLRAAADLLAVAVDRAHLASLATERSEWFERMAHTDPLTGLANRRTFDRVLELELARAGRQGGEVSVALFDVDAFGETNASAGHETGDDILRLVAAALAESVRLVDTVARYGGDEFVLIAPGSAGVTVARRVLDAVAALEPVGGHAITVSAGVARFPTDGASGEELLAAAEAALEQARAAAPGTITSAGVTTG
jgi:diguanylate cyclase (GGDEF)-like protein